MTFGHRERGHVKLKVSVLFFPNWPTVRSYKVSRLARTRLGFVSTSESVTKALPKAALLWTDDYYQAEVKLTRLERSICWGLDGVCNCHLIRRRAVDTSIEPARPQQGRVNQVRATRSSQYINTWGEDTLYLNPG